MFDSNDVNNQSAGNSANSPYYVDPSIMAHLSEAQPPGGSAPAPEPSPTNPITLHPTNPAGAAPAGSAAPPAPAPAPAVTSFYTDSPAVSSPPADQLTGLKQQALHDLTPLVNHLDQTPEEKFKTTMMLIQASDNASLVKDAYAAAQQIKDDKARAQALIDVVNEINYFTQKQNQAN